MVVNSRVDFTKITAKQLVGGGTKVLICIVGNGEGWSKVVDSLLMLFGMVVVG